MRDVGVKVTLLLDAHGGDREREDEQLAEELAQRVRDAILAVIRDPRYARILLFDPDDYGPM